MRRNDGGSIRAIGFPLGDGTCDCSARVHGLPRSRGGVKQSAASGKLTGDSQCRLRGCSSMRKGGWGAPFSWRGAPVAGREHPVDGVGEEEKEAESVEAQRLS